MTVIALVSAKHSPGTTTTAVALALAVGGLVVEADPEGGDVAARARVPLGRGLVTMAAAARHPASTLLVHTQLLPSGVEAVVAPTDPHQASSALAAVGARLVPALRSGGSPAFVDCGRWSPVTTVIPVLGACDMVVMVTEPTVSGIEHVRARRDRMQEGSRPLAVMLVGARPYGVDDVQAALALPVVGPLPIDPRGAVDVYAGPPRAARKSALCRAARAALDQLIEVAVPAELPA